MLVYFIVPTLIKLVKKYPKQTFIIGVSQALAFIPGVSRSGITMTTGRALGIKREAVAKYSFMLSAPIVLAATVFKLKDFIEYFLIADLTGIIAFVLGVLFSFVVGIFVIKYLSSSSCNLSHGGAKRQFGNFVSLSVIPERYLSFRLNIWQLWHGPHCCKRRSKA